MHIWHLVLILPRTRRWTRYLHFTGEESAAPGFLTYTELKATFFQNPALSQWELDMKKSSWNDVSQD